MPNSLRARVVYPVGRPPIEGGVVTIEGERIAAVGSSIDGDVHDLGDVALLPGLVNAHTHLEFSYLKQPLGQPGIKLPDWIRLVIAERGRGDISPIVSHIVGLRESSQCGVTTLGDIATNFMPAEFEVIEQQTFVEVIAFSRARASSSLSNLIGRLDEMQRALGELPQSLGRDARCGISPHAPYTVSPELLRVLIELAEIRALPVAMHLAESPEEIEFLRDGSGPFRELLEERSMWDSEAVPCGSRPLDYLRMLAKAPRALVIHGNYLDVEERAFLGEHAKCISLVYCPRTHAYFEHSQYPLGALLGAGARVALGTDSRASNPDLDLLAEMRHVARVHPTIDPQDILRMGTLSGAEALGRAGTVGSLTRGKLANFLAVPLPASARGNPEELLEEMLANNASVSAVWVRGQLRDDSGA